MHRDFEHDEQRRRYRRDDDPRDDPRERYGNEEDPWSHAYRRTYAEDDLPRRLHDDRPYDRPGYEPEFGRTGGRENVDRDRRWRGVEYRSERQSRFDDRPYSGDPYGFDWEQPPGQHKRFSGDGRRDDRWQGGFYGQGRRFDGRPFEPEGHGGRSERYGQPSYGYSSSPYDEGEIGSWYGGDTGMGNPGMSASGSQQYGTPPASQFWRQYGEQARRQRDHRQYGRDDQPGTSWGQRQGQFSGRGPRGYRRSDERIREDVCELLTCHHDVDASEMDVEVHGATVILRGTVDSGRTRRLAEELVEEIPGVQDVQNELRVNRQRWDSPPDSERMIDSGTFADDRGGFRESGVPAYGVGVAGTAGVSTRTGRGEPGSGAGAGPSQHGNRWQVRDTMDVVGSDGATVGTVKAVHGTDFHVDRPKGRDLFVPFSAVRTVDGERVMLSVRASEVDDQHWPAPDLTGSNEGPVTR